MVPTNELEVFYSFQCTSEWNSEKNMAIFKSAIEYIQYTIHDNYMDNSKEIKDDLLKEFKNLDINSSDAEDGSEEVLESRNDSII